MGSIALLRQTYLDADWYASANDRSFQDLSLESWNANQELPRIFEAGDKYSILRADKVADEFGIQYIIAGDGREYQILEDIRKTGEENRSITFYRLGEGEKDAGAGTISGWNLGKLDCRI